MAKIRFKQVTEREPWDVFAEEYKPKVSKADLDAVANLAREYHIFLDRNNPELGACLVCGRKFKRRKRMENKNEL